MVLNTSITSDPRVIIRYKIIRVSSISRIKIDKTQTANMRGTTGMPSSQLPANDVVLGDASTSVHANVKDLNGKPSLGDGNSSPNGVFQLKKVNGCLQRAEDRPILVIQPEQVSEDVEY